MNRKKTRVETLIITFENYNQFKKKPNKSYINIYKKTIKKNKKKQKTNKHPPTPPKTKNMTSKFAIFTFAAIVTDLMCTRLFVRAP